MASNWQKATTSRVNEIESALVCKKCQEANRPGRVNMIHLDVRSMTAVCDVCSASWRVDTA